MVFQTAALSWAVGSALLAASVSGIAVSPWEQRFYVAVLAGCAVGGVLAAGVSRRNAGRQRWEADPDQDCTP
ncbi:hypothetical protein AB0H76_33265 [Nocardia sp. NPDC050712]|uniref:hypothetical protein n=1 Tax=Nocardia sp. NPDC050712 TaxID=3155518 RepID=UPI0033E4AF26